MKLTCIIDEKKYDLNVSSDKPLSRILNEVIPTFSINNACKGASCGNCMIILDDDYTLACLIPAFRLKSDKIHKIQTYETFSKTVLAHDIERAYAEVGSKPCYQCYASKTLLISSLILRAEKAVEVESYISSRKGKAKNNLLDRSFTSNELIISGCECMELSHIEKIIKLVCEYRSKRNGIHK